MGRTSRQELISGWNQDKLNQAKVGIIGVTQPVALAVAGLQIGHVSLYDMRSSPDRRQLIFYGSSESAAVAAADKIMQINPEIEALGCEMKVEAFTADLLEVPQAIVCSSTDKEEQIFVAKYCVEKKIPLVSVGMKNVCGEVRVYLPGKTGAEKFLDRVSQFPYSEKPNPLSESILGSIAADELRKILAPINDSPLENILVYNPSLPSRFELAKYGGYQGLETDLEQAKLPEKKNIVIVGAGALGTFFSSGLVEQRDCAWDIKIVDYDTVEEVNLNRQFYYWDALNQYKSETLAKKLAEINPKMKLSALNAKLTEKNIDELGKPDIIMCGVDNFKTDKLVSDYCIKNKIPMVNVGTSAFTATVRTFVPNKTGCLDCQINLADKVSKEKESCIAVPNPSICITNSIAAFLGVLEAEKILREADYLKGTIIKYDSQHERRFATIEAVSKCNCVKE